MDGDPSGLKGCKGVEELTPAVLGVFVEDNAPPASRAPVASAAVVKDKRPPSEASDGNSLAAGRASGEYFPGPWVDVGTPQRLADLDAAIRARQI